MSTISSLNDLARAGVVLSWMAFAVVVALRRRHKGQAETRRDRLTILGIVLQGVAFAPLFAPPRGTDEPFLEKSVEPVVCVGAIVLAVASVAFAATAIRALGKQWSLVARLVEGHTLVTEGPYRIVRHPIYTGLLGMVVATGLAMARPPMLALALCVYVAGTSIRVRREERLLREAFGDAFEAYASRVPAVVPVPWRRLTPKA